MKPTHIVVVQSGWVFVGAVTRGDGMTTIQNASCIRRWGTTKGLGELALVGPTKDTVLDPCSVVHVPNASVLFMLTADQKKWP